MIKIITKFFDLEDYRKVWGIGTIVYLCCNYHAVAVFHKDSKELECPKCGKMTRFTRNKRMSLSARAVNSGGRLGNRGKKSRGLSHD
jgi:hypothetical protein